MFYRRTLALYVLTLCAALSEVAFADFHVEPYVGYGVGDYVDSAGDKFDMKGLVYGGRLGFASSLFFGGAEIQAGSMEVDSETVNPEGIGAFLGVKIAKRFRAYGAYLFQSSFKNSGGNLSLDGDGYKYGIGVLILSYMSFNVEYVTSKYDEALGMPLDEPVKVKFYAATLSFPFEL